MAYLDNFGLEQLKGWARSMFARTLSISGVTISINNANGEQVNSVTIPYAGNGSNGVIDRADIAYDIVHQGGEMYLVDNAGNRIGWGIDADFVSSGDVLTADDVRRITGGGA